MLDTVVIYGDDVCCSVVFDTLVCVFVFNVMWSELLMTSDISCLLWSSVYECHRVECAFTSPVRNECGMSNTQHTKQTDPLIGQYKTYKDTTLHSPLLRSKGQ